MKKVFLTRYLLHFNFRLILERIGRRLMNASKTWSGLVSRESLFCLMILVRLFRNPKIFKSLCKSKLLNTGIEPLNIGNRKG